MGGARSHGQSPRPHTWSSAMILSPSSSSSSSFEEQVVTGGGDGVHAEAGSSAGHFVALACRLGPASSLLAYGRFKAQMLAEHPQVWQKEGVTTEDLVFPPCLLN